MSKLILFFHLFCRPEVAGYIECDPCKTTTISDPNAYLRGHCQTGKKVDLTLIR